MYSTVTLTGPKKSKRSSHPHPKSLQTTTHPLHPPHPNPSSLSLSLSLSLSSFPQDKIYSMQAKSTFSKSPLVSPWMRDASSHRKRWR